MADAAHRPIAIRDARFPQQSRSELGRGTVLISEGRVSAVLPPDARPEAATVIDAAGRILMPGFIDAHSHGEGALLHDERELGHLRQGVTGVILGQDGISFAPTTAASAAPNERYFSAINGPLPAGSSAGMSVAEMLSHFARSRLDCAALVPAGTVRTAINGFSAEPLDDRQLDQAEEITRTAIAEGAAGISLGLEYVPNGFADPRELRRYARISAETGLPLVAHIRGYEQSAPGGLREFITLSRETGAPIHISHLHAPAELALPLVDEAIDSGVDLTFDSYPYRRGNTILAMLTIPADLQQQGPELTLAHLADPAVRARLESDWFPGLAELFTRLTITVAAHPDWVWAEGLALSDVAERAGRPISETICDMLIDTGLAVGAIVRQPAANRLEDVRAIANHRAHLGSSDGIFLGSHPHPRGWGSFARMLHRHVIHWGDWSWWDAAEHLSLRAAARFGFGDRGLVRESSIADFCLVDPDRLRDRASYEEPTLLAEGIDDVLVAGTPVLVDGRLSPSGAEDAHSTKR